MTGVLVGLAIVAMVGLAIWISRLRKKAFLAEVDSLVAGHREVLASKFKRLCFIDEYGSANVDGWNAEVTRYIERQIAPIARKHGQNPIIGNLHKIVTDAAVGELKANPDRYAVDVADGDGAGFEDYCAQELERLGLTVVKTDKGADQGVDLIVNNEFLDAVVQCKNYGKPVGNAAVQEVAAGRDFYSRPNAVAVVISRSGFTAAARQLAKATNVLLMDAHDIAKFDELVLDFSS